MHLVEMSEPASVPEFFVNGIGRIDDLQTNVRFVMFGMECNHSAQGRLIRVARMSIIMPTAAVSWAAMQSSVAAAEFASPSVH